MNAMTDSVNSSSTRQASPSSMSGISTGWIRLIRAAFAAVVFAATTVFLAIAAYPNMFSVFKHYDDEGYLLISLKWFQQLGGLYDQVFSQYGPMYYLMMDGLFNTLRLSVTHDNGRLVSLGVWLAVSLVCGLVLFRLTKSIWIGCLVQLLVLNIFRFRMMAEPMHPSGMLCLLLACLTATALLVPRSPRLALGLQGVLVASMMLIKINIGSFAFLSIALTTVTAFSDLRRRHLLAWSVGLMVSIAPAGLMAANLTHPWAQQYALLVGAAAAAVALILLSTEPQASLRKAPIIPFVSGGVLTAVVVCVAIILRGTSPAALFHSVLVAPFDQAKALTFPLQLPPQAGKMALLALVAACIAAGLSRRPERTRRHKSFAGFGGGVFRLLVGVILAYTVSGIYRGSPLGFLLVPLLWVASLNPHGLSDSRELAYARHLLPPLAVLQTLHAYPVAGSQVHWGSFLLLPVGAICVFDGLRQLAAGLRAAEFLRTKMIRLLSPLAGAVMVALVALAIYLPLGHKRALYQNSVPLSLPGASRIHLSGPEVAAFIHLSETLRNNCTTFISVPGLNSFYFWTGLEPPTGFNTTMWMNLLSSDVQLEIIERIRGIDRLCVIQRRGNIDYYAGLDYYAGRGMPLVDYLYENFAPFDEIMEYEILTRSRDLRS